MIRKGLRFLYWQLADFTTDPLLRKALEDAYWEGYTNGDPEWRAKREGRKVPPKGEVH